MKNKFSKEIKADKDAYYMSCPEIVAKHIASQLSGFKTCVELCCAVGMLSVQLAKVMDKVYGIDINKEYLKDAEHNAKLYSVSDKITFIHGGVLDVELLKKIKADAAIIDPDWSSGSEKTTHVSNVDDTQPSWRKMFNLTSEYITKNIVSRIPKTWTFETLKEFGPCKIENIIWNGEVKFKVAYFLEEIKENKKENAYFD